MLKQTWHTNREYYIHIPRQTFNAANVNIISACDPPNIYCPNFHSA